MNNIDESLSQVFDIEPITSTRGDVVHYTQLPENEEIDSDNARLNIYGLIDKGNHALDDILEIAKQSESPRSFEVFTSLLKTVADMNMQLLDIQKKKQELTKKPSNDDNSGNTITNNAIFVGSTSELHNMLKQLQRNGE